jgi:hypothetical protein
MVRPPNITMSSFLYTCIILKTCISYCQKSPNFIDPQIVSTVLLCLLGDERNLKNFYIKKEFANWYMSITGFCGGRRKVEAEKL